MHKLAHEFTSRKVSPWGGIKYFQQTYEHSGMKQVLRDVCLRGGGSNASYDPVDLAEGSMTSVVLGSKRMAHTGMLRTDEVIREIFGWKRGMASQSTFSRFFARFDKVENQRVFTELMRQWWSRMSIGRMTIDVDSTVIERYGNQEGATVGYNPTRPGRPSHHPLMAFCAELNMVIDSWMRKGSEHDSSQMDMFVEHILDVVPAGRIGLMRLDRGFYDHKIMHDLEERGIDYIIKVKKTARLMDEVLDGSDWYRTKGRDYMELDYRGSGWLKDRRIIAVRTARERPGADGPALFREDDDLAKYEYAFYVTNTELSARLVQRTYDDRADCENRIRELKYDYGIEGFAMKSLWATEAAFRLVMLAYDLMSLFKQKVLTSPKGRYLSTVRFECIEIGSYLVRGQGKKKMKMAATGSKKHFLEHLFKNVRMLEPPFRFSNA